MSDSANDLARLGLALTPDERTRLIDLLLESLHEPTLAEIDQTWSLEVERRLVEYDRGEIKGITAEHVFAKARSIAW